MTFLSSFGTTQYMGKSIADIFHNGGGYWDNIKVNFQLEDYSIAGSPRPEQLAYQLYGDPNLYWVLLLINQIVDPWHGWIKDDQAVQEYTKNKYANVTGGAFAVHHHESPEGDIFYDLVEFPVGSQQWYDSGDTNRQFIQYTGDLVPITRIEHELNLNEEKRVIKVIRNSDITRFLDLMEGQIEKVTNGNSN